MKILQDTYYTNTMTLYNKDFPKKQLSNRNTEKVQVSDVAEDRDSDGTIFIDIHTPRNNKRFFSSVYVEYVGMLSMIR